jgi:hypothetical protein
VHPLIKKQLTQILGEIESWENVPEPWRSFAKQVEQSYLDAEAHRQYLEQTINLASRELHDQNYQLRQRNTQLTTAIAVSNSVATLLNPAELIDQTVNLIKHQFGFYYVGLFLVDHRNEYAVLRAGTSPEGDIMIEMGHQLRIGGDSMVGWCVAHSQARIALDVGQEAIRFNNPYLPDTRSEIALPLLNRGRCLGALSVQSEKPAAFSDEDIAILQSMADQVAGALENAYLFEAAHREIEERKETQRQLEENRNLLRTIIDTLPIFFHVKDTEGRFLLLNHWSVKALERLNPEIPSAEILGKTDFDFFPPHVAAQFRRDEIQVIESGQPLLNKEEFLTTLNGEKRWSLTTKAPLRDSAGDIVGTIGASQDITRQKEAEEALREAHDTLEIRVRERTIQLEAINKELEAFSYSVSHDLRAPLRAINGFSQALVEDFGDTLDEVAQTYLRRIRMASERMGELIDDLLNLSRVTRRELTISSVNLSQIAAEIIESLQVMEPERQVEIHIMPDLLMRGDESLVRILLENLLHNAWKFSWKQEHAKIEVGFSDENHYYFVRDNGVGFDMAYADKLFRTFQRLHSANEFEGTGIGLATVKRIILRHGGEIWAEGVVNQGATFYFRW